MYRKNHSYFVRKAYGRRHQPVLGKSAASTEADDDEDDDEDDTDADEDTDADDDEADDDADEAGEDSSKGKKKKGDKTFTQAEVNAILAREKKKRERADQRKEEEADEDNLARQKKFESLAAKRKEKITTITAERDDFEADLEEANERVEALEEILGKYAKAARKGLPKKVQALLDKLPVDEQLSWLAENGSDDADEEGDEDEPTSKRTPKTPRGDRSGKKKAVNEERRKRTSLSYQNRI